MAWRRCGEPAPSPPDWQQLAARLAEALRDTRANATAGKKSCGHDFFCVCSEDAARSALAEYAAATGRATQT